MKARVALFVWGAVCGPTCTYYVTHVCILASQRRPASPSLHPLARPAATLAHTVKASQRARHGGGLINYAKYQHGLRDDATRACDRLAHRGHAPAFTASGKSLGRTLHAASRPAKVTVENES